MAFLPNQLPPADLRLEGAVLIGLSEADRAIGTVAGVARGMQNPGILVTPFLRREAVLSSRIEGTQASMGDLALFEAHPEGAAADSDVREVANYVHALGYGLDPERKLPLNLRLLRDLHRILMDGVRGGAAAPGEFRRIQNHIGPPGARIEAARYVPPPVPDMTAALDQLERFIHAAPELPPLIRIALVHYQFEAIHPFLDGNGRVGRLLITLQLIEEKLLPEPLLYLSAYFDQHRDEYYSRLLAVSQRGDFEGWLGFFLAGVARQSADTVRRAGQLRALRDSMHERLRAAGASSLMFRVSDLLTESPALSANAVMKRLDVTHRSALQALVRLSALGIVREPVARQRNRVFLADSVIELLERDAA